MPEIAAFVAKLSSAFGDEVIDDVRPAFPRATPRHIPGRAAPQTEAAHQGRSRSLTAPPACSEHLPPTPRATHTATTS